MRRSMVVIAVVSALVAAPVAVWASHQFEDVPPSHTFHDAIAWMADNGITVGCNTEGDEFCPDDAVTRAQMSAFMKRLAEFQVVDAATALEAASVNGYDESQFVGAKMTVRRGAAAVADGANATAAAQCEEGEVLISGGGNLSVFTTEVWLLSSRPSPNTEGSTPTAWVASASNPVGGIGAIEVRAYAICASFPQNFIMSVDEHQEQADPLEP